MSTVKYVAPLVAVALGINGELDRLVELEQHRAKPVCRCRVIAMVRRRLIILDGRQPTLMDDRGDGAGVRCKNYEIKDYKCRDEEGEYALRSPVEYHFAWLGEAQGASRTRDEVGVNLTQTGVNKTYKVY